MKWISVICILLLAFSSACSRNDAGTSSDSSTEPVRLTVMTHDSFAVSEAVLSAFEEEQNAEILLLPAGDTGAALNQAILSKENPLADIFFGVDNTFLGRALEAEIFEPYKSPMLENIPEALQLDPTNRLLPMDFGFVCLNYDKGWFENSVLNPPTSLEDLIQPDYHNLTVVQNPATSSPGLAFLLTTIGAFGDSGDFTYIDYWEALKENGVLITQGWEDAYFGQFSAAGDGDRPIVVSYASSPPAEVVFADPPVAEPPTASVTSADSCFKQIEFVGIMTGSENRTLAETFIDFMLDVQFQEDIPLNMFVFPANELAELPEVFARWADVPEDPIELDSELIDNNRDFWIEEWTERVLR